MKLDNRAKNIRLVVTDLDGTLLDMDKQINDRVKRAIDSLDKAGIAFTFVTGRPRPSIEKYAEQVRITAPIISCNGAVIYQNDKILYRRDFSPIQLRPVFDKALEQGMTVLCSQETLEFALARTTWTDDRPEFIIKPPEDLDWNTIRFIKANIINTGEPQAFIPLEKDLEDLAKIFSITRYGGTGAEIIAKNTDKSTGLKWLCEYLGVDLRQVLACGDNENDNELLREAGIGIAVANACQTTKEYADYISESSRTDGVAEALEALLEEKICR